MADKDLYQIAPSPNKTIGCQDLLKDGACIYSGWLRRQSLRNRFKIFSWPQVYIVISGGCVYCYKNETASRPVCAFSLYGYDRVYRAREVGEREATWAFKMVHVNQDFRSYLFSSSCEREMLHWMKVLKEEMLRANGKLPRTQGDGLEYGTYQDAGSLDTGSINSQEYSDVETNIYEDATLFSPPQDYINKKEDEASDDEMDALVLARPDKYLQDRPPIPPPVPKRPLKQDQVDAVVAELKRKSLEQEERASEKKLQNSLTEEPKVDRSSKPPSLRKRGDPDGSSLKKDEQVAAKDFWSSIFFYAGKEKASEIIRQLADEGVYLVRVNDDLSMVLHVYASGQSRKFQIFQQEEKNNLYTLKKNSGDDFKRVEDLVYHYYSNPLPNLDVCLTDCYLHHPEFQRVTLS